MYKWAAGLLIVASAAMSGGPEISNPNGRWRTQMHGALVDISTCPDRSPCAFLAWVTPSKAKGMTKDLRNPDAALRSRPLIGVPILWGLKPSGRGWKGGRVYNPETGQTFKSSLMPLSQDRLRVTGCWGILCRDEIWVRVQ